MKEELAEQTFERNPTRWLVGLCSRRMNELGGRILEGRNFELLVSHDSKTFDIQLCTPYDVPR